MATLSTLREITQREMAAASIEVAASLIQRGEEDGLLKKPHRVVVPVPIRLMCGGSLGRQ